MAKTFKRIAPHLYKRQYQISGGDWSTRYYGLFVDWKGKRRVFPLGSDLKTAREELKVLEARNIRKEDFDKDKTQGLTLFPWIQRFLSVKASKKSLKKDRVSCERIKAFFGDRPLDSILTSEIEAYKQKRMGELDRFKRTPQAATINRELACLRSILILAAKDGIIEKVPYVKLLEEKNTRSRVATQQEFEALGKVSPPHLQEILICLWDTGMRKAEALNLTWDRVDLRQDFIKLLGTGTKTGEGRLIPISPRLKAMLKRIREREKVGKVVKLTERVFLFKRKPLARFDRAFKTACKKSGIEGLWVHDLRASFATRKISEGFDRDWVKMITGHRTDHVFRRYNRPSPEALRSVVAKDVNEVLTQQRGSDSSVRK